jgi:hypothetical protein
LDQLELVEASSLPLQEKREIPSTLETDGALAKASPGSKSSAICVWRFLECLLPFEFDTD